jgi:hypothetical protein
MADNFTSKSSPNLDRLVSSAQTVEDVRELCKADLERRGVIVREANGYGAELVPEAQPAKAPALPATSRLGVGNATRVIYPAGNFRFELYGDSEQELDEIESRIRRALGVS